MKKLMFLGAFASLLMLDIFSNNANLNNGTSLEIKKASKVKIKFINKSKSTVDIAYGPNRKSGNFSVSAGSTKTQSVDMNAKLYFLNSKSPFLVATEDTEYTFR